MPLSPDEPTKSSWCGSQACVVVTNTDSAVLVEDANGTQVAVTHAAWRHFVAGFKPVAQPRGDL